MVKVLVVTDELLEKGMRVFIRDIIGGVKQQARQCTSSDDATLNEGQVCKGYITLAVGVPFSAAVSGRMHSVMRLWSC